MTNSLSIDLPFSESEYPEMLLPSFTDEQHSFFGAAGAADHLPADANLATADGVDGAGGNTTSGIDDHNVQDFFDDMMDYGDGG